MDSKKDKKDERSPIIIWWGKIKAWVMKKPYVSGGIGAGVLVLILLISFSGGGTPASSSVSQASSTPSTSQSSEISSQSSEVSSPSSSEPLSEVIVTFNTQGGTSIAAITGQPGTAITQDLTTTRTNYTFVKFASSSEGTDTLDLSVFPNTNLTAFAIWEANNFTVTFYEMTGQVRSITSTNFATLILTEEGELYGTGRNSNGVFGNGQISSTLINTYVHLTDFLPLEPGEIVTSVDMTLNIEGGITSALLTSHHRLLVAGSNYNLIDNRLSLVTDMTTYRDITPLLNLQANETVNAVHLGIATTMVVTSEGRYLSWGANDPQRLFPQPDGFGANAPVGTPTDVTAALTASLNDGETIELLFLQSYAGTFKTTENRYFIWGTSQHALLLFQDINTTITSPLDVTSDLLDIIGEDQEIVEFKPIKFLNVITFKTSDNQWYDYGDYRYVAFPNVEDRPTFNQGGLSFYGDPYPFNITESIELEEGEVATHLISSGLVTNQNRYYDHSQAGGIRVSDLSPLILADEIIVETFGDSSFAYFLTSFGRVFLGTIGVRANWANITPSLLSAVVIETLDLPFQSSITYVPTRQDYVFEGWFTTPGLTTRFTSTVPANNDLKLYGRFVESVG